MIRIRHFEASDWGAVWPLIEKVFRAGETYAYPPQITEKEAYGVWIEKPSATFVGLDEDDQIVGTYYLKPNQPGLGAHVCNCGYIVADSARGRGIASAMCVHSQQKAKEAGFKSMQYNLVVSTNHRAVRLWQKHGFRIIGTLPGAFDHRQLGFVDAHVMFKPLDS